MELYIHYQQLPQDKELADVVGELNEVLEDNGSVCGGRQGRIDLDLEDERVNPKYAGYLNYAGFVALMLFMLVVTLSDIAKLFV